MNDLVKQYPQCLYWVEEMKKDKNWKDIRFKKLNVGYPKFVLYPFLFDEIDIVEFLEVEQNRLPLFIGSQFGISPRLETVYNINNENNIIAVLSKSLLSGAVAGLKICLLKKDYELEEIIFFENVKK